MEQCSFPVVIGPMEGDCHPWALPQAKAVQLGEEAREAQRQLAAAEGEIQAAEAAEVAGNAAVERALRQVDALNRRYEKLTAGLAKGEDTGAVLRLLGPPAHHRLPLKQTRQLAAQTCERKLSHPSWYLMCSQQHSLVGRGYFRLIPADSRGMCKPHCFAV